jgi:hypothetical protein
MRDAAGQGDHVRLEALEAFVDVSICIKRKFYSIDD